MQLRLPVAMVTALAFPLILYIIFAATGEAAGSDDNWTLIVVLASAITAVALYHLGAGIAEERAIAWDPYQRTLARPSWLVLVARVVSAFVFIAAGSLPVVVLAYVMSDISLEASEWAPVAGVLALGAVAMSMLGVAIGYTFGGKSAVGVATVLLFPMLWLGGFFGSFEVLPDWAQTASEFVPTRRWSATLYEIVMSDGDLQNHLLILLGWTLGLTVLALLAVWRDSTRSSRV